MLTVTEPSAPAPELTVPTALPDPIPAAAEPVHFSPRPAPVGVDFPSVLPSEVAPDGAHVAAIATGVIAIAAAVVGVMLP